MQNIFENCSYHSKYEPYFLNCTNTTNQCVLIQDVGIIQAIDFWANLCIPFTLFVIAFILNGYYLSILIPEFRKMNDTTKKQYIFVVSRGISSLSASSIMMVLRLLKMLSTSFTVYFLFFLIDDLSFYSLLGSYVGSTLLLYLATVRPIFYSIQISVRIVYKFALVNVLLAVVLAVTTAIFQAAEVSDGFFHCDVQHCQPIINIAMFVIIATSFLIPIITLTFVLVTLCFQKSRTQSIGNFTVDNSVYKSARTRLAWTLFTFTLISLTEMIPSSFLVNLRVEDTITICVNFYQADHLFIPAIMNSFQTLAWGIALIVDPLCALLFDPRIRKVWVEHVSRLSIIIGRSFEACCHSNLNKEIQDK
ncbi:Putative G-protein coupled receptor B0244.5 [Caenorhabditis elegans]|uniref:Putative G-protein coupled receptor B0244.5 n=1 Tax=Caenorhabditis elegans TaxID=6239 RepID=YS95_CAEEL|nr:Putative G-protein coupled receptor B0244.5 [Caenorhabditis elegans]Q10909.3 RecName: Full=Putative G-protein coupled receptor B0244.5 [Caenorhabditis elegans]CCD61506.1 Putative G-protein coupled receptor B0244.5 [Caenorhabditis elegans]|eukprot:NP_498242.3 Putative G-protein coupled receptor B0244.5 [Caenorhabditis elegans]